MSQTSGAARALPHTIPSSEYSQLSLKDITERIAYLGDRLALRAFHENQAVFGVATGHRVVFARWVEIKRAWAHDTHWWAWKGSRIVDDACDLLLDRFSNLPTGLTAVPDGVSEDDTSQYPGPDCRNYFRGCLAIIERDFESDAPTGCLDAELRTARIVEGYIRRHFYLCLKESLRSWNPLVSRYDWKVDGHSFSLWLPRAIEGAKRREWLEKHVEGLDPMRPFERERIQDIIDDLLGVPRLLSLDSIEEADSSPSPSAKVSDRFAFDEEITALKEFVAKEKAESINMQRPAIRRLGRAQLQKLVPATIENTESGEKSDAEIAQEFGLSTPTYSRFGGSDWGRRKHRNGGLDIPDLWINLAHVLANNKTFREMAKRAGVLDQAMLALTRGRRPRMRSIDHE